MLESPLPPLSEFKMSNFENRKGEFEGRLEAWRIPFLQQLIATIRDVFPIAVGVAVDTQAFGAASSEDREILVKGDPEGSPYTFAVSVLAGLVNRTLGDNARVSYVLDALP